MKRITIMAMLIMALVVSSFAQYDTPAIDLTTAQPCSVSPPIGPGGTTGGTAFWNIVSQQNLIWGQAGNGPNQVQIFMAGSAGVIELNAPNVQLTGFTDITGTLRWNFQVVTLGPPDSGGPGFRALRVPN